MADDIITRDDNGDLAVNVVTSTEANVPYNYDDCFTLDTNGRRALRVVGAGGGDSHNKGYFATQSALEEAYPTAEAGDWAIVGATDTVWVWDEDNSEWVDSDQKGQVTSVNNQTGAVTLTASDVGAATTQQGAKADTAVQPSDLATVATSGDYDDLLNKPTIPSAQVNSDWNANSGVAQILNKPSLATVATSGSYSDLSNTPTIPTVNDPTITITQGGVTKGSFSLNQGSGDTIALDAGGGSYTAGVGIDITNNEISLADTDNMPTQDEPCILTAISDSSTDEVTTSWTNDYVRSINNDYGDVYLDASSLEAVPQWNRNSMNHQLSNPQSYEGYIIQYNGETDSDFTNGYFYKSVIDTSVPESATLGTVVEVGISNVALDDTAFIAAVGSSDTDTSYTFTWNDSDGEWYFEWSGENVGSDLAVYGIAYDGTPTEGDSITVEYTAQGYKWEQVDVQPSSGGSYLPLSGGTLTGGVRIDISGTPIWKPFIDLYDTSLSYHNHFYIGYTRYANQWCIGVDGRQTINFEGFSIYLGNSVSSDAHRATFGINSHPADAVYTSKINSGGHSGSEAQIRAHDINVPSVGGTMVVADYTGASQGDVLTLDNNGNAVWAAPASGTSSISVTLPAADWVNDEQTVTVSGVKADSVVFVSPAPASASDYASAGILCTAQAADSLTFTCDTTPSNAITVNVVCM